MIRNLCLGTMALGLAAAGVPAYAGDNIDPLITKYAAAHKLPESLVRRVIKRESGGNPRLVYHGNYGLMQIRLGTARSMGYGGSADGLLDPDTNMSYAVKYLAGAYRVANGDADRAVHYYQTGYYYAERDRSGGEGLRHRTEGRRAEASEPHLPGLLARLVNALSHRAEPPASHQRAPKLRRVRVQDRNVASSSSSLYGGRRDVY
jgi:soluble lytic murein transglycosylase-like protein